MKKGFKLRHPESKEIIKNKKLRNLAFADILGYKEPISLLTGADYYNNLITGKIIHLNRNLVAVESIFGWYLQN